MPCQTGRHARRTDPACQSMDRQGDLGSAGNGPAADRSPPPEREGAPAAHPRVPPWLDRQNVRLPRLFRRAAKLAVGAAKRWERSAKVAERAGKLGDRFGK